MGLLARCALIAILLPLLLAPALMLARAAEEGQTSTAPLKLESVLGRDVVTSADGDAGRIIDLLVDRDGTVRAAVVEFGGFLGIGTRKVAIEWSAFRFYGRSVAVDVSREQIRAAPDYKATDLPSLVRATSE
jgi:predicted O-methyltransferase YrrM